MDTKFMGYLDRSILITITIKQVKVVDISNSNNNFHLGIHIYLTTILELSNNMVLYLRLLIYQYNKFKMVIDKELKR